MMDRRVAAMLIIGLTGGALILAFLLTTPSRSIDSPSGTVRPSIALPSVLPPGDPLAPLVDPVTVVDGQFDDRTARIVRSPSSHKNQSKLFFAEGSWWGVLMEPTSQESRIQRLDWATQLWHDTGVVVDDRSFARADVLVFGDTLYVASAGSSDSPLHAVRVSAYAFDRATDRWLLRPDFPVTVNSSGVESSLIERADDGRLWVAYIQGGRLFVTHSTGDDHGWVAPYRPVAAGTEVASDQVGMVAVGGEVVLVWSNQNDEAIYATTHKDGRPDDDWAVATTIIQGLRLADNHVNIKALSDGRLFAAIKTSLDTVENFQPGWDQILLLARQDGVWSSQQFGQIRDRHTRPILLLDTEHGDALVFATIPPSGGRIVMKRAPLDRLRFPTGPGADVMATTPEAKINDATSTKQPVDATTGLVVLASDNQSGRYIHLAASLGGPAPGTPRSGPPPDGPEPAPSDPVVLVDEPGDAFEVGSPVQPIWRLAPTRADGTVTYVRRDGADHAVRLRTTGSGELRPCRSIGRTRTGRLLISMDVRLDRQGADDTTLLSARGESLELAGIRVDAERLLRISRGGRRATTDLRLVLGRWYRVELDLDVASHTFTAQVFDERGRTLVRRVGQPWRSSDAATVDGICLATSTGRSGLGMSFDNLRVTRIP